MLEVNCRATLKVEASTMNSHLLQSFCYMVWKAHQVSVSFSLFQFPLTLLALQPRFASGKETSIFVTLGSGTFTSQTLKTEIFETFYFIPQCLMKALICYDS